MQQELSAPLFPDTVFLETLSKLPPECPELAMVCNVHQKKKILADVSDSADSAGLQL